MPCNITSGYNLACKDAVAGIKAVYFINYSSGSFTLNSDDEVTAFPTGLTAYKWEVKGAPNGLTTAINSSRENGTTFFESTLTMQVTGLDAATQKAIKLASYGRPQIVVHTNQGDAILLGRIHGCDAASGNISTGAALGDLRGYNVSFVAQEQLPPNFLDAATEANPFAGVTNPPTVVTA
jgi:hypothetical protein